MSDIETELPISDFNFDEWCKNLGLNRKITQVLRQEEFTTKETLELVELKDLKEMGLPMGTTKVIMKSIQKWNTNAVDSEDNSNKVQLEGAGKTLDTLLGNLSGPLSNPKPETDTLMHMDPRIILTLKAQSAKALHITQFLTEKAKRRRQNRRREFVIKSGSEHTEALVLKTDDEHPYLGIYLEEWGAANMRLLNHLLASDNLRRDEIEFYLAYSTKIFDFAEIYDWNSVLNFDYLYREQQAEHRFKWGTFSPHMELQILVPKRARQTGTTGTPYNSANSTKEECKIFKAKGNCPFGAACKYQHKPTSNQPPKAQTEFPKNA